MITANDLAQIGVLLGDPARANMLTLLLDGREHSAGELGLSARVSKSTASWHLSKLMDGGFVTSQRSGRNRLFKLSSPEIARIIETSLVVAAERRRGKRTVRTNADDSLQFARTCYDHLAGRLGVSLTSALIKKRLLVLSNEGGELRPKGQALLADFGVDFSVLEKSKRVYCRSCMDWTERRMHLAGAVGASIANRCFELGWIERMRGTRALKVTGKGLTGFNRWFKVTLT